MGSVLYSTMMVKASSPMRGPNIWQMDPHGTVGFGGFLRIMSGLIIIVRGRGHCILASRWGEGGHMVGVITDLP